MYTTEGDSTYKDDDTEPTGREEQVDPGLDVAGGNVVARADDAGLIEMAVQLDDDLAGAVVVDDLKLAYVAWECSTSAKPNVCSPWQDVDGCRARSEPGLRKKSRRVVGPAV